MALLPKVKLKSLVSFPATALGRTGIDVSKQNGNYYLDLDYSKFAPVASLPAANQHLLVYDSALQTYVLVPPSVLGGGISDAPLDSKVYGRQSAGWIDAWAAPTFTGLPVFNNPAGYGFRMIGDGSVTPSKYLRVNAGHFQITNDANAIILDLTDGGVLTTNSLVANPTASTTNVAIKTTQHAAGTNVAGNDPSCIPAGSYNLNSINIPSDATGLAGANSFVNGLAIVHNFGGPTTMGGRQSLFVQTTLNAADNPSNTAPSFVGGCFFSQAGVNIGGTGLAANTSRGGLFGLNPVVVLYSGATFWNQAVGMEVNTAIQSGSSVYYKAGISISQEPTDQVPGAVFDAGINLTNASGAVGWKNGVLFSNGNGQGPLANTGSLIATQGASTVQNGIDFSSYTFNGYAFNSQNAKITGAGNFQSSVVGGGTSSSFYASSTAASLGFNDTGGGVDGKVWDFIANAGNLVFRTVNDAGNATSNWLAVTRGPGISVASVSIPKLATDAFSTITPVTVGAATYSVTPTDHSLLFSLTANCVVTLPPAANYKGRWLILKNITLFAVTSASANVAPLVTWTPGTAILPATAGKWCALQSDGGNWITMMGN